MQFPSALQLSQFNSTSQPVSYLPANSAANLTVFGAQSTTTTTAPDCHLSDLLSSQHNEAVIEANRDTNAILASDLTTSSQWLLNPFCSGFLPTSLASTDVTSLLGTNFLNAQFPSFTLGTTAIETLANLTNPSHASKEIIRLNSCCLYPPKPNATLPPTPRRERPLGCRTVFVGGLPENITEEILQEVFQNFGGEICAIRTSKKNFCHIRFEEEEAVDNAMVLSGYRMKIGDQVGSFSVCLRKFF